MSGISKVARLLEKHDFFDCHIDRHGIIHQGRDYELIAYIPGSYLDQEVQYIFIGCLKVNFEIIIDPTWYSLDDRLLDLSRQDEPDYPQAFIWAGIIDAYPGWKLEIGTRELRKLGKSYGLKFHKILIETNAYNLNIVFHDLEVNIIKTIEKHKPT